MTSLTVDTMLDARDVAREVGIPWAQMRRITQQIGCERVSRRRVLVFAADVLEYLKCHPEVSDVLPRSM